MSARTARRGEPLLVLAIILGAWLIGRVLLWAPPFPSASAPWGIVAEAGDSARAASSARLRGSARGANAENWRAPVMPFAAYSSHSAEAPIAALPPFDGAPAMDAAAPYRDELDHTSARRAAGHQMLLAAAFSHRQLPVLMGDAPEGAQGRLGGLATSPGILTADRPLLGGRPTLREARASRLSADAWLFWRDGSNGAVTPGVSTYGRSQAGAVLRYRLFPPHSLLPTAYARATRTLEGSRQGEVAAGLSLRPLPRVPLTIAAEARVTETAAGREVRPAGFAVTQIPPVTLPLGLRGEAYLQGGYVGGDFETAFVDGQAKIDRRLAHIGDSEVRLGVAAWGGAQKGASRLDVGPSASVAFKLGEAPSRIAVDYRLRVAGAAAPASGPAVTFSAGF